MGRFHLAQEIVLGAQMEIFDLRIERKKLKSGFYKSIFLDWLSDCHRDPASKQSANLYDIYLLLCVQCWSPDDGQRDCPKHVEFYSKNKFEELVHLVGFIVRIYHDSQPSECQICFW